MFEYFELFSLGGTQLSHGHDTTKHDKAEDKVKMGSSSGPPPFMMITLHQSKSAMELDMNIRLNELWKKTFRIFDLRRQLDEFQHHRTTLFPTDTMENEKLNALLQSSKSLLIQSTSLLQANQYEQTRVENTKKSIIDVDQQINKTSIACNELQCTVPQRIEIERALASASESLAQTQQEQKYWERKLTKTRNQKNRAATASFAAAQRKAVEIEQARSEYEHHLNRSKKVLHMRKNQSSSTMSKTELPRLENRNNELQKEYEVQLREEEALRRKTNRMADFEEMNEAIRLLVGED
jgi:hypothetical protein